MWYFLEGFGAIAMFIGTLALLGALAAGLEIGFGVVFFWYAGGAVLLMVIGFIASYFGDKGHDKWLKETYPEAWKENQAHKLARKGK